MPQQPVQVIVLSGTMDATSANATKMVLSGHVLKECALSITNPSVRRRNAHMAVITTTMAATTAIVIMTVQLVIAQNVLASCKGHRTAQII